MDVIANPVDVPGLWRELAHGLAGRMAHAQAHPARTVVLLPYAQLLPLARAAWAAQAGDGFTPRFETTRSWAQRTGFEPEPHGLSSSMARDLVVARHWLDSAGLGGHADALAARLVEAAWQLAPLAAAVPPVRRPAWAAEARIAALRGLEAPALQLEAAVARIAVEWAAASSYATDGLLQQSDAIDLLVIVQGLQPDPVQQALADHLAGRALIVPLPTEGARGVVASCVALDAAQEAELAAACVLKHLAAGRHPVALIATDRLLTRRVAALLRSRGIPLRDEPGWRLSTTRSAARLMAALRACAWDAASDEVLDWLKNAPAVPPGVAAGLERRVRRAGVRQWRSLRAGDWRDAETLARWAGDVGRWRESMQGMRTLSQWLEALRGLLQACGQWAALASDAAGAQLIDALRLSEAASGELQVLPGAGRRLRLQDFTGWCSEVLEAESFVPDHAADAPVALLPLSQVLGRPFAAVVVPGCDEKNLPASPEPAGAWTRAQRQALGLPSAEALAEAQRTAWQLALQVPHCDLLWRAGDERGEPLLPSPLVQLLQIEGDLAMAGEPRELRVLAAQPTQRPEARAAAMLPTELSASAYEDLRRCPYRFFVLRQLGLREADEIDTEVEKRDFGTWLHSVLREFHETVAEGQGQDDRRALLDRIASTALAGLRLEEGEFLPFEAAWPQVRDGYLGWLAAYEAAGARFEAAESEHRRSVGGVTLMGRIDRIDAMDDGAAVMDYKTESLQATRERMKRPLEDTQLAFYAALLDREDLNAAYLNIGERGEVKAVPHERLLWARDRLLEGIAQDFERIARGEPLAPLGEGRTCEFCDARGLCRKDFWS